MNKIKDWILSSGHKSYCNLAPGNVYADDDGKCDCGMEDIIKKIEDIEILIEAL